MKIHNFQAALEFNMNYRALNGAKRPKYIITNLGTCDNQPRVCD